MARHKVNPLRRLRVAQACDSCKRRKEKCNGAEPCALCKSRRREDSCRYTRSKVLIAPRPLLREAAIGNDTSDSEIHQALNALEDPAQIEVPKLCDGTYLNSAPVPKVSRMLRDSRGKFSTSSHLRPKILDRG